MRTIRRYGDDRFVVDYESYAVTVHVDRVRESGDGLRAELAFYDSTGRLLHFSSQNLLSSSWRKGLAAALAQKFHTDWAELIDDLCVAVVQEYRTPPKAVLLWDIPEDDLRPVWHLEPILPLGVPTVLYGDGGTGKSLLAMGIAAQIASGKQVLPGTRSVPEDLVGPVVYLDWEDDPDEHRRRLARICEGHNIEGRPPVHYIRMVQPLSGAASDVAQQVEELGAVAVVLDSLAHAAGSDPWRDEPNLEVFRALRSIGKTALVITHVSKVDLRDREDQRPYGTVFVRNAGRNAWWVQQGRIYDEERTDWAVVLTHHKSNRVGRQKQAFLRIRVGRVIRFESLSAQEAFQEGVPVDSGKVVLDLLRQRPGLTYAEIGEELSMSAESVRSLMRRLRDRHLVVGRLDSQGGGRGHVTRWYLAELRMRGAGTAAKPQGGPMGSHRAAAEDQWGPEEAYDDVPF
jgi:DNA-directed RNA polymerase specialized sigma24 family protein